MCDANASNLSHLHSHPEMLQFGSSPLGEETFECIHSVSGQSKHTHACVQSILLVWGLVRLAPIMA